MAAGLSFSRSVVAAGLRGIDVTSQVRYQGDTTCDISGHGLVQ